MTNETMRERFHDKFGILISWGEGDVFKEEEFIDFIEQEISQALEKERNRIKNKLKEYQEKGFDMQTVVESDNLI